MRYTQDHLFPVSAKGIVFEEDKVWLRKNERDEWELPGGKIDAGEQPGDTVVRELEEELGFRVELGPLVDASMYRYPGLPEGKLGVLVVSYLCRLVQKVGDFEHEGEAGKAEFHRFAIPEVDSLTMPDFYKQAILKAWALRQQ
jgi:8-oxo-dGTP pyrophosphatase MutT (NUDIX family)